MMRQFLSYSYLVEMVHGIVRTTTFRNSGVTFVSSLINGALGAVFFVLAARMLGPEDFGVLNVVVLVVTLGVSVGGLGVNTGLVRFVGEYASRGDKRAFYYLKLAFKANLTVGLLLFIFGVLLSERLSELLFGGPDVTDSLMVGFAGVISLLLFGFVVRYFQAYQKFVSWGAVQIVTNLVRALVVIVFFYLGSLSLMSSVYIYSLVPLAGFIIVFVFFVPKTFLKVKGEMKYARGFFDYNKWIAGFTLIASFSSRLDTFVAARMVGPSELGFYSAANQMVFIIPHIVGALGTVIAPKMSSMSDIDELKRYFWKSQLFVLGIAVLGLLAAPLAVLFIPIIYGSDYSSASIAFVILLLSMLIFLISVPVHNAILYFFSSPKLLFWLSVAHLLLVLGFSVILIPQYGIVGAALSSLMGSTLNFVIPMLWFVRKKNR